MASQQGNRTLYLHFYLKDKNYRCKVCKKMGKDAEPEVCCEEVTTSLTRNDENWGLDRDDRLRLWSHKYHLNGKHMVDYQKSFGVIPPGLQMNVTEDIKSCERCLYPRLYFNVTNYVLKSHLL